MSFKLITLPFWTYRRRLPRLNLAVMQQQLDWGPMASVMGMVAEMAQAMEMGMEPATAMAVVMEMAMTMAILGLRTNQ